MKANELRIGNWVSVNGIEGEVTISALSMFEDTKVRIEPIPLTEEWLLKFRFEKAKFGKKEKYETYYNGYISIIADTSNYYWLRYYSHNTQPEIKYVHQLQNLYFALTGQELTPLAV